MTSLNHYAFGCVDDWMFRKISGIDMAAPGFKEIVIAPEPDNAFTSVKRTYISEYGEIAVRWSMDEGKFKLKVKNPLQHDCRCKDAGWQIIQGRKRNVSV